MELRLLSEGAETVIFSRQPFADSMIVLPGAELVTASGSFGSIHIQSIQAGPFILYFSQYNIEKDCTFYFALDEPSLELHFMSRNGMEYNLTELGVVHTDERQFNITYLPYIENTTSFKGPARYSTFDIHFPVKILENLVSVSPLIDIFLNETLKNKAAQYSSGKQQASAEMIHIMNRLLFTDYTAPVVHMLLESKAVDLLLLALEVLSIQPGALFKINSTDIECIYEAERVIMQNLENPQSLIELAHRVGINDSKLKKLFKHIYGMTVYQYIMMKKIEKAKALVIETDMSFGEIAFEAGFKNVSNFNEAFRREFDVTPTYMRKNK